MMIAQSRTLVIVVYTLATAVDRHPMSFSALAKLRHAKTNADFLGLQVVDTTKVHVKT